jgi:hypothetical protein
MVHQTSLMTFSEVTNVYEGLDASSQPWDSARDHEHRRARRNGVGSEDFTYDGGGMAKGGTLTLLASGRTIGEGRVEKMAPFEYSLFEGQDIGEDTGTPVYFSYTPPFTFTGTLGRVTVEMK